MTASKLGLKFDDLGRVRVVDEDTANATKELHEQSSELLENIGKYQKIAEDLVSVSETLAEQVEREKLTALQSNIKLQHEVEHREMLKHQLQMQILEKQSELERLNAEYHNLQRVEQEQQDMIDQLAA
ncbi:intraflagellar transport protein 20 homolog [Neocloeon triangulifer]|uniref:intraflagellar transport protein 20 homolog n=1 Tax=Neocloeon triangulifer TaxID=2078957 RepID=UPI00286F0D85|nr:intraflagellar transport protein 20 homolog [Neocloeon triangulifer]XP_059474306.1 intraflagellar transport protein 20 homolog [Neocloeon triangulifer]XP_059474315.1 intraflagellar transport protein 20 homolog [Neocloeon triangulifer]